MKSEDPGDTPLHPMDWLTTDQIVEEVCRRYPHVLLVYTRQPSPDDDAEGSLVVHTTANDSAGCAIGLGMARAASLFMESRLRQEPDEL